VCAPPSSLPSASTPGEVKTLTFGQPVPSGWSRSVLVVSHHLDGLLRAGARGLVASHIRPWGSSCFRRELTLPLLAVRGTTASLSARKRARVAVSFPTTRFTPFEDFPSPAAVPCHHGRCPLAVVHRSSTGACAPAVPEGTSAARLASPVLRTEERDPSVVVPWTRARFGRAPWRPKSSRHALHPSGPRRPSGGPSCTVAQRSGEFGAGGAAVHTNAIRCLADPCLRLGTVSSPSEDGGKSVSALAVAAFRGGRPSLLALRFSPREGLPALGLADGDPVFRSSLLPNHRRCSRRNGRRCPRVVPYALRRVRPRHHRHIGCRSAALRHRSGGPPPLAGRGQLGASGPEGPVVLCCTCVEPDPKVASATVDRSFRRLPLPARVICPHHRRSAGGRSRGFGLLRSPPLGPEGPRSCACDSMGRIPPPPSTHRPPRSSVGIDFRAFLR